MNAENIDSEGQLLAPIQIISQFIKDLSFESPSAPEIFQDLRYASPDIPTSVDCKAKQLKENQFEVTVSLHVHSTIGHKSAFIIELEYSAVVLLGKIPEPHTLPVLLIEVPRQMYPFIREIVADVTVKGGFPPLMLQVIDFKDIYEQKYIKNKEKLPQNN
ncbi:MAG: protein-export chaperone SecB [Rhodospirillaceae bacterium]|nr:protein-export chaperone SecB [Rhodospirillaceae bacterium]|tara:strand:+ start:2126 stop:2605 length:480 start_codon:yes stop_codon:yes gene_type:complete